MTSVSQYGITWTWTDDLTVGQFANGDYYVVAPSGITITEILPASVVDGGRTMNGTMVNPGSGETEPQGFDSLAGGFDATKNDGRPGGNDLSVGNPLVVAAGSSVVSSESLESPSGSPKLKSAAVLTVLASAPEANSFRPPYCGTDKSVPYTTADLNYAILKQKPPVASAPALAAVELYNARPWIEVRTNADGRNIHPTDNQPDYGREMTERIQNQLLSLQLNYTNEQKEMMFVRLVQYGIDVWGAAKAGGVWVANGGHNVGRKPALLLAGMALGSAEILAYADAETHFIFQEDFQTFYIDQNSVDLTSAAANKPLASMTAAGVTVTATTLSPHGIPTGSISSASIVHVNGATPSEYNGYWVVSSVTSTTVVFDVASAPGGPATVVGSLDYMTDWHPDQRNSVAPYEAGNIGVAEWGISHNPNPEKDNAAWDAQYRSTAFCNEVGIALAVRLMDGLEEWNWTAYFDFVDRAESIGFGSGTNGIKPFAQNMWNAYRIPSDGPTLSSATVDSAGTSLTLEWSESCTNGAGGGNGMSLSVNGAAVATTYSSGSGSTTYVYTVPVVGRGSVLTLSYIQPGDGIEATTGSVEVDSFSGISVTNDSTQEQPAAMSNGSRQRLFPGGGGF